MKALSLWQPWASLIAIGAKRIETRSWVTAYRGPIAIHAAKRFTKDEVALCFCEPFRSCLVEAGYTNPVELPLGCIIAVAKLVEIFPTQNIRDGLSGQERAFGDYTDGRYGWALKDIWAIKPVPTRGYQQLWDWDETGLIEFTEQENHTND